MSEWVKGLYEWTVHWAATPQAEWALFLISVAESSFFPLPPDILLITMALSTPSASLGYALISTVGSVLGGVLGYYIGHYGGQPLLRRFISGAKLRKVEDLFNRYDAWAIVIAAFTPIPYKVFTIASGVFNIRLRVFIIASVIGRAGRFFLVAALFYIWGPEIKVWIDHYFEWFTLALMLLLILGFVCLRLLTPRT